MQLIKTLETEEEIIRNPEEMSVEIKTQTVGKEKIEENIKELQANYKCITQENGIPGDGLKDKKDKKSLKY